MSAGGVAQAAATNRPVAVSPGSRGGALIGTACPTFSWGAVPGAKSYRLVVYPVEEGSEAAEPALSEHIAGSATAWTPSLDRCLEPGGHYAWSVRAVGGGKGWEWSAPSFFRVVPRPSEGELERAIQVVQRYLGGGSEAEGVTPESQAGPAEAAPGVFPGTPPPLTPAATLLSVDGNVDAVSFSGDGSALTNLTAGDLSCASCVDGGELVDGSVSSADISDETISQFDIGVGAVAGSEILDGSVTGVDILDGSIAGQDIDASQVQARVSGSCASGSSIRQINANGSVTCQTDNFSDWQRFSFNFSCSDNFICFVFVGCGSGRRVLGGGLELTTGTAAQRAAVTLSQSKPRSDTQWEIEATNRSGITMNYRVWATCATVN